MFKEDRGEFKFEWSQLGNIEQGRPNMGPNTSVAIYRLMQFTLRDSAIKHTDAKTTERIFYDAGYNSGKAIYKNLIGQPQDLDDLVKRLQKLMKDLYIGILRFEEADVENMKFILTVSEDLDCSGLPMLEEAVCTFDEGVIAGVLESFTGIAFDVKEIDCWCTGSRTCRFEAKRAQ